MGLLANLINRPFRYATAEDLESALSWLKTCPDLRVVLADVENTLVPYGTKQADVCDAIHAFENRTAKLLPDANIQFISNGNFPDCKKVLSSAKKPLTAIGRVSVPECGEVVVLGDQVITDGLLAWRLGGFFLHIPLSTDNEPLWPSLQRRIGSWLMRIMDANVEQREP